MKRRAATLGVLAVVAAGCAGSVQNLSVPTPGTTVAQPAPPASLPSNLGQVRETPVPGVTTTTVPPIAPGPASLAGAVLGPNGPVAGATVEADHLVGNSTSSARATTAADGSWSIKGIVGGRYRVRAWQSPGLDMATAQVFFLTPSDAAAPLTLQLTAFTDPFLQVAMNPAVPSQGQVANLVVQVTEPTVDADGIETSPPVTGAQVTLVNGPNWEVKGGNPTTTDGSGAALFQVICTEQGTDPLSAQVASGAPVALQMPSCGAPPATTTTTVFGFGNTTTTTCPPAFGELTTTTVNSGSC